MRSVQRMQLVTIARFAQWNGRGREGDGADRQPEERSNPRDGHGAKCGVREVLESERETGADVIAQAEHLRHTTSAVVVEQSHHFAFAEMITAAIRAKLHDFLEEV